MKRTILLLVCLGPALAYAQGEELENPGTVLAVQDRTYRMSSELVLGIGIAPLDAFYKDRPERIELAAIKKATRKRTRR